MTGSAQHHAPVHTCDTAKGHIRKVRIGQNIGQSDTNKHRIYISRHKGFLGIAYHVLPTRCFKPQYTTWMCIWSCRIHLVASTA